MTSLDAAMNFSLQPAAGGAARVSSLVGHHAL